MRQVICLICMPLLAACARIPSLEPIAQVGSGLIGAGQGIQRAGVSAESAAVNLRRGLEGLDPAGIKELLATNARLRAELEKVQSLYLQGMGQGVVDITGRNVQVRATRTVGDLIINAWIDTPANQFWSGRITNQDVRFPVNVEAFLREYPYRRCRGQTGGAATSCISGAQRVAPTAANLLVQEEFQRYLRTATTVPAPGLPSSIANPRFGGSGEHKVFFQVVPIKPDAHGNWAARLEIWLVDGRGREANVFVYDVDNHRFPAHRLGEPLNAVVASLVVRTSAE
jgi:hypothetical protein